VEQTPQCHHNRKFMTVNIHWKIVGADLCVCPATENHNE